MKTIIIRKIPPIDDFKRFVPKRLSRFPQLYLELLENKNKLNQIVLAKNLYQQHLLSLEERETYCVKQILM